MSSCLEFGDWIFHLTSIFELLMFCGFQTGWSSLVFVLVEEGVFSHLCEQAYPSETWNASSNISSILAPVNITSTNNCLAQQEMLNLAYTLATSVSSLFAFPIGVIMDLVGPRITRIASGVLLGSACLLLSFVNKKNPGLLFIGLISACIANLMMFMTPQACMQRFKKGRAILIGLYCGAWVTSSLAFLGFKMLYEYGGIGVPHFFRFLAVGCFFLCVNAALLYSDSAIPPVEEKPIIKQSPKRHKLFSSFRNELKKLKLCLGHMMNGQKETFRKTDHLSDEWNQILPKVVVSTVDNSQDSTKKDNFSGKRTFGVEETQLTKTNTMLDLSDKPKRCSDILGPSIDLNRVTYAECPTISASFTSEDCTSLNMRINFTTVKVDQENCLHKDAKTMKVLQNICQKRDVENFEEKPCEDKDLLDNRSTGLQMWTANSAVSYLKAGLSFKHCVLSPLHILAQVFVTVCKIRTFFFVGSFSNFISDLSGGDRTSVAQYINIFGISHVGAMLMAPLLGYVIDRQFSRETTDPIEPSKETEREHQKFMRDIEATPKAMDFVIQCCRNRILKLNDAVVATAFASAIFCVLALIPSLILQIVTFQFYIFVKVASDTVFTSILVIIFPQRHLGKLLGLASLIGAIFSLVQYPLFIVMEVWFDGRTFQVNVFFWVLCLLAFGFPLYLWRKSSKQEPYSLALVNV